MDKLLKDCVAACNKCIDDCSGKKGMEECVRLCKINRDVCKALMCANKCKANKDVVKCLVRACKQCCKDCVKECGKYDMACCKQCVKSCNKMTTCCTSRLSSKKKKSMKGGSNCGMKNH